MSSSSETISGGSSSSAAASPPALLWLPARSEWLEECWIATRRVESIYTRNNTVVLEVEPKRLLTLRYDKEETAQRAAECFALAMQSTPTAEMREAYPKPLGGDHLWK
jgi:hypothetical protein